LEAAMPDFNAKIKKQLGTPTADSTELAARALCSPEQVRIAMQRDRERAFEDVCIAITSAINDLPPKGSSPAALASTLPCWPRGESSAFDDCVRVWSAALRAFARMLRGGWGEKLLGIWIWIHRWGELCFDVEGIVEAVAGRLDAQWGSIALSTSSAKDVMCCFLGPASRQASPPAPEQSEE
jgi:hypothetical protein